MGGNSGGGLSAAQTSQLNAMLAATRVPPSTIGSKLLTVSGAPTASPFSSLAQDARTTLLKRQGYNATVKTSPLGDIGFGTSLMKPGMT